MGRLTDRMTDKEILKPKLCENVKDKMSVKNKRSRKGQPSV